MLLPLSMAGGEINYTPIDYRDTLTYECIDFYDEVARYDWDTDIVMNIMNLESGCNPLALNDNPNTGDYSVGLMQINLYGANANHRPSEEELKIPEKNIEYAYELYQNGGYNHWTVYTKKMI